VPPAFVALACQKYCVLFVSGTGSVNDPASVGYSGDRGCEVADGGHLKCIRRCPLMVVHVKVGNNATFVEPVAGNSNVGTPGAGGTVVKLKAVENALEPPAFFARTCQ